jgi:glucose-1-phosphate adenylyltransferase
VSETQWYEGTADAVFQNIDIIDSYGPDYMIISLARPHLQDGLRVMMPRSTARAQAPT